MVTKTEQKQKKLKELFEAMGRAGAHFENALTKLYMKPKLESGMDALCELILTWYNRTPKGNPGAGYKRIGRILVQIAKDNRKEKAKTPYQADKRRYDQEDT